jgi:hypothetical protein
VLVDGFAANSSGIIVDTSEAYIFAVDLAPGQIAPFYLDFAPENSVTGDQSWVPSVTNVTVSVGYISDTNQTMYSGLTIPAASTSAIDSGGTYTVNGIVENTGTQTTGDVWVVATFYNSSGAVISLNYTDYLDIPAGASVGSLAPGDTVPFAATPMDNTATLSSEIANYSLIVETSPITSSASPSPTATPAPGTSPSSSTQPTQSPAPLSSAVTYGIVGAIVVVVVVLAALLFLRKRQKNPQFEPPPPPPPPPPT